MRRGVTRRGVWGEERTRESGEGKEGRGVGEVKGEGSRTSHCMAIATVEEACML